MSSSLPTQTLTRLGRYEVLGEIARGSLGVVYEARDPDRGGPVALKVALVDPAYGPEVAEHYRRMLLNEAETAGKLSHPNILQVLDVGAERDLCYIVMELVRGGTTLRAHTRPGRLLPVAQVIDILFACGEALDYAHRQGVIHRDVKPSNILLGAPGEVQLADFSIAHIDHPDLSRTMPLGFVGSPRYMSPEQVREEVLGPRSDLFSLAIVGYELLTGHHPFASESFSVLVHKLVNVEATDVREHRPELPEEVERVMQRALAKEPRARYRMGLEFAAELGLAAARFQPVR